MSSEFRNQLAFWMKLTPTSKFTNAAKMNILDDLDNIWFIKIASNISSNNSNIQS